MSLHRSILPFIGSGQRERDVSLGFFAPCDKGREDGGEGAEMQI